MMSWSTRRKALYLLIVLLFVGAIGFYFSYPLLKENPTCTDGKQNGTEKGIDCGGICPNLCEAQVHPISLLWQRFFKVAPGIYDAVGYIENQNVDSGIPNLLYRFKLYDENNVLIAERDGRTYLGPNQSSVIFEGAIRTGERIPRRVFLEFEDGYRWVKVDPRFNKISLSVGNKNLEKSSTTPRLLAEIKNESLLDLSEIEVAAILRDSEDNAISASKTILEKLSRQSSGEVFFTWPAPFPAPARIEIIPRINPFTVVY